MRWHFGKIWEYLRSKPKTKPRPTARLEVETLEIRCVPANLAPTGASHTVPNLPENRPYIFQVLDFGFSDPNMPPDSFQAVEITTLPTAGTLTDNGMAVTAGQFVQVSDITSGELEFTPAHDASGSPYGSFTFQVESNGSTAGGGANLDPNPKTMTVDVEFVNQPPSGTNNTVTTGEGAPYTFKTADFGFTDPNTPAQTFQAVEISTLPANGTLADNGTVISAPGSFVPAADIANGLLVYTPGNNNTGSPYDSFTFQVQNSGGTLNGGVDTDPSPKTMFIDAIVPTQPPSGTSNTITMAENGSYAFKSADFGFSDPNTPANSLAAVEITTLPTAGTLTDNGSAVTAGEFVSASDISSGKLVFKPASSATGSPYGSFTFQVESTGSTVAGGINVDPTARTMTMDVIVPNKAPSGKSNTVSTDENTPYVFKTADFGFTDPNTPAESLAAVEITTLPSVGTLTDNGVAVTAGQLVSASDITNGLLSFKPAANATGSPYTTFTFQVEDSGSTMAGGAILDPTPKTMTIDAITPTGNASGTITGTVFVDYNGTGTFASNDLGIPGVTVTLTGAATDTSSQNVDITEASESSSTVTITTASAESFKVGDKVTIANATVAGYDGTFTIVSTPSSTSFTFTDSTTGLASDTSGSGTATVYQNTPVDVSAVTDANGDFTFNNVLPGTYHLSGGDVPALIDGSAPTFGNITATPGITVTGGKTASGNDAGYKPGLAPAYITVAEFLTDTTASNYPFASPGSGQADANSRANNLPTIDNQIANQTVAVGTTGTFDLAKAFTDPDLADTEVTFNITANGKQEKINVDLNDATEPQTVANFLDYVKAGDYNNAFFTRETNTTSDGIGVLQAGGATIVNGTGPQIINSLGSIPDEHSGSNTDGTLALANTGAPNSGSDEFFFNTADNSSLNGNYAVFGQVADTASQDVLNSLSSTPTQNLSASTADISTASVSTDGTNTVTITTTAAETFKAGQTVTIAGLTAGYNGTFTIASAPSSTSFTYVDAAAAGLPEDTTAGGTADAGPLFSQQNPGILDNEVPLNTSGSVTNFPTTASSYIVINSITIDNQPEALTYSNAVVTVPGTNTPSTVVTARLVNEHLNLTYNSTGTATVSVTATDKYGASITMSSNVTVVTPNQAPTGQNSSVMATENTPYIFQTGDFRFTDPNSPAEGLAAVEITSLPASGTLTDSGSEVTAGQFVSASDIANGKLVYTAPTGATGSPYTTFTFQVEDTGSTAAGGVTTDPNPKTMSIDIT